MIEKILRATEKCIPKKLYTFFQPAYHYLLSVIGVLLYRRPSKDIYVVAVTGTKGKSSVTEIINTILEEAGYKTALSNTIRFKIDKEEKRNKFKMTMPGRFFMQKFLRDAVKAGCTHAIVEMSSEGARFFRHKWIDIDTVIFNNLHPEHIESHGSYENYRNAKLEIVRQLNKSRKSRTKVIVNADDKESDLFLHAGGKEKISFSLSDADPHSSSDRIRMNYEGTQITSPLIGEFNIYNILAAITFAKSIGIEMDVIKKALEHFGTIPGRVQKIAINEHEDALNAYIDYAHTPESLEALYKAFAHEKKVCVLGNTGGGRDTWKRPKMAEIADQYCDHIVLTNEDPYDEDPEAIINEMKTAITNKPCDVILDRREAIRFALTKARGEARKTVVLISGKGTDPYIMEADGKKTPWSDAEVTREELIKLTQDN